MRLELVVLGTSSRAPTLDRNQGGYLLRFGRELVLFDPGESCQRQLARVHISPAHISRICITHFHGDHCLGLPGVVQQHALINKTDALTLHYGPWGRPFIDRLLGATEIDFDLRVDHHPLDEGDRFETEEFALSAERLDHTVPTIGWRLDAGPRVHLVPEALASHGIEGPAIGELRERGSVDVNGKRVELGQVSTREQGAVMAFVMDTRPCAAALDLARDADLLVAESTYLTPLEHLAAAYGHMTARQAAELARDARARHLVLSHYSSRWSDEQLFAREAAAVFADVAAARDLDRFEVDAADTAQS